jgi:hypothetical protein
MTGNITGFAISSVSGEGGSAGDSTKQLNLHSVFKFDISFSLSFCLLLVGEVINVIPQQL